MSEHRNNLRHVYSVGQKRDTARTLHYIVREVSLFWPTLYSTVINDKSHGSVTT